VKYRGLNELLCAALINENFRSILLKDPIQAISLGYQGQHFTLNSEEYDLVVHICAQEIEDFAGQVFEWMKWKDRRPQTQPTSVVPPQFQYLKEHCESVIAMNSLSHQVAIYT
jgi:hypothetical protein